MPEGAPGSQTGGPGLGHVYPCGLTSNAETLSQAREGPAEFPALAKWSMDVSGEGRRSSVALAEPMQSATDAGRSGLPLAGDPETADGRSC